MSVEPPPTPGPQPHRPGNAVLVVIAVLLYGGLLLIGGKIGVPTEALVLFAGLWPPTCILLGKLRS
ncbi:hypothetical protein ABZS29_38530 [Kribbella sp. NPDC005582]|uniref:hypothetical protein n=1 Tax=Kribbella sp. NPDC005582 TaxID=3156893 RepID=UPI0033BC1627